MVHLPLLIRARLWRITRSGAVRSLYERLEAAGVVFAQLDHFRRPTALKPAWSMTDGPTIEVRPVVDGLPPKLAGAPVAPSDTVVVAERAGSPVGWCLLSDRPVYVPELDRRLRFPGSYLWRLYVIESERGRGVGSALIARSIAYAGENSDSQTLSALVAPDNLPSRKAFRGFGFEPTERYTSVGLAGRTYHRRSSCAPKRSTM